MSVFHKFICLSIEVGRSIFVKAIDLFRFLKIKGYIKNLRKIHKSIKVFKTKFEDLTGFSWSYFQDSLFIGTIILLTVKTIYRIAFLDNPIWYINMIIYVLGTTIAIKYDLLPPLREKLVEIIKKSIGKSFWYSPIESNNQRIAENDITLRSKQEFTIEYILTALVWVKLLSFQEPILFIFTKFILIYFLIFNKFLVLASIISFIGILSRLVIYISDFSQSEFSKNLKMFEYLDDNETYAPTWRNANIVLMWVCRTFNYRESFVENRRLFTNLCFDVYSTAFMHKFTQKYHFLLPPVYTIEKDIETGENYVIEDNTYSAKESFGEFETYRSRFLYVSEWELYCTLQPVLKKKNKNTFLFGIVTVVVIAYLVRTQATLELFELATKVITPVKLTIRLKTEKDTQRVAKVIDKELEKTLKEGVTHSEKIPHMSFFEVIRLKSSKICLNRFNYMTKRNNPTNELSPLTHWEGHNYCTTQIGHGNILTPVGKQKIIENYNNGVLVDCIPGIDFAKDRISYPQFIPRRNELIELNKFFEIYFNQQYIKSRSSHVSFIFIKYEIPTSPLATLKQVIDTLEAAERYHILMSKQEVTDNNKNEQLRENEKNIKSANLCNVAKTIIFENKNKLAFADNPDAELQTKINRLNEYSDELEKSPKNIPPVISTNIFMQKALGIAETRVKDHHSHSESTLHNSSNIKRNSASASKLDDLD